MPCLPCRKVWESTLATICRGHVEEISGCFATGTLAASYRGYIECLNQRDWGNLGRYVRDNVSHNGKNLGLSEYDTRSKLLRVVTCDIP